MMADYGKEIICIKEEVLDEGIIYESKNTATQPIAQVDSSDSLLGSNFPNEKPTEYDTSAIFFNESSSCVYARLLCEICGEKFTSPHSAKDHMEIHIGEDCQRGLTLSKQPFMTDGGKCTMKTDEESGKLFLHRGKANTKEKSHVCNECGRCFSRFCTLNRHLKIHTGEKPHQCKVCKRSFCQYSNLRSHLKIHTGEKPHVCNECGKSFSVLSGLRRHARIHTGEKPYLCLQCGKSFRQSSGLAAHIRIHSGERPYVCKECGKSFSQSNSLRIHLKIHTREKLQEEKDST